MFGKLYTTFMCVVDRVHIMNVVYSFRGLWFDYEYSFVDNSFKSYLWQ
jgi:hypothetical protein